MEQSHLLDPGEGAGPGWPRGLEILHEATANRGQSSRLHRTHWLSVEVYVTGMAQPRPVCLRSCTGHTHAHTHAHPGLPMHTRTSNVTAGRGESPSLPRHRDCLFHPEALAARQRLELRRGLGGQGDLGGPGGRRTIEHRQNVNRDGNRTGRSVRPGHTYHLTHVPGLALLSRRSRQTLGQEHSRNLAGRRCATPVPHSVQSPRHSATQASESLRGCC